MALGDDLGQDATLVPRGYRGADLVFGDHRGEGGGDVGGGAQEGGDGLAGAGAEGGEVAGSGEAAQARDQAIIVRPLRGGEAPDLDRLAQALGPDRGLQLGQGGRVQAGAVAGQRVGLDGVQRDVMNGGHGGPVAGGSRRVRQGGYRQAKAARGGRGFQAARRGA